jgi:uncharacterized protein YdbL (DUF1318 family)
MQQRCSVKAPEVQITGEKTALENQVLGTYQQIQNDAYVIASTRAIDSERAVTLSSQKQQVLESVENRKFNKDDIDELKRDRVVGENNKGFLSIFPTDHYNQDMEYKRMVDQLVVEENRDREVIYERVIAVNELASETDVKKLDDIFAKLQFDNSESGTRIQQPDGSWIEKAK